MDLRKYFIVTITALALIVTSVLAPQPALEAQRAKQTKTAIAHMSKTPKVTSTLTFTKTSTPTPTEHSHVPTVTVSPTASSTVTASPTGTKTATATITATNTRVVPSPTLSSVANIPPFRNAPLCENGAALDPDHDTALWHGVWDSKRGCHYDHEHGQDVFTSEVARAFPGFDLMELLGGVQVGHTNPSSPLENTHKHGGFKWQVDLSAPNGCQTGFEDGTVAVKAYAIQFHAFGRQDVEHEARNHSSVAMLTLCKDDNPNDVGYMFVTQLQEYGVRVMPYQGMVLPYPDNFQPIWDGRRGQYFTTECFGESFTISEPTRGPVVVVCRATYDDRNNNNTIWTSKITGTGERPPGSRLFRLLFRGRDNMQRFDASDLVHPFTWRFVCGGEIFVPDECRFNSSTFTVHEVMGDIPSSWDGTADDLDPRPGRVTFQGYVDRFGNKMTQLECVQAGGNCYPIKLVSAFVGRYSSELSGEKVSNPTPGNTPERDIYFCGDIVCTETSSGAVPSGFLGAEN